MRILKLVRSIFAFSRVIKMMSKPTLKDYLEYVDEHMTNEDNIKDRMHKWNLQEFQIYFGHTTSKEDV